MTWPFASKTTANPAILETEPNAGSSSGDDLRVAVFLMASAIAVLVLLGGYFSDRHGGVDEIGLYNPTYMDVNYGKMTYPVHGNYRAMVVHPPVHYKAVAAFMHAGLSLYYAQATPTVLILLFAIWLIVSSKMSSPLKIGLLFGIWLSIGALSKAGLEYFGMRPEGDLNSSWLTGLIALESGRLDNWKPWKLAVGGALLTYASTLQYYAAPACLGILVYAGWGLHELGPIRGRKVVYTVLTGALACGLPVFIFWVVPQAPSIFATIAGTRAGGGPLTVIAVAIREHVAEYHWWASNEVGPLWLQKLFAAGVPLALISTPILLAVRGTRLLALAAAPLQFTLLLFAWHKHAYYFLNEIALCGTALVAGLLTVFAPLLARLPGGLTRRLAGAAAAMGLVFSLWHMTDWRDGLKISVQPRFHEAELARAAGRAMLGPNAKVASRLATWYSAGEADWYDPEPDLLWSPNTMAPNAVAAYLSRFDALAESQHMSDDTHNSGHKALLSWYLDGVLHLRGFFFAEANSDLSYVLLRPSPTPSVSGFGIRHGQLYRFSQTPEGQYVLLVLAGPQGGPLDVICAHAMFCHVMAIPPPGGKGNPYELLTAISGINTLHDLDGLPAVFQIRDKLYGTLTPEDKFRFVAELRAEDRPIRFHRTINTGYSPPGSDPELELKGFGPPPPAGAVPLTKVLDVNQIAQLPNALVERGPGFKVTTSTGMGAFAAAIPLEARSVIPSPCWIEIRASVSNGRVGIGVFNRATRSFIEEPALLGETKGKVLDLYIPLKSLAGADALIVRSATTGLRSVITLDSVVVWLSAEDWPRYASQLETFK